MENNYTRPALSVLAILFVILVVFVGNKIGSADLFMNEALSTKHGVFEGECENCHEPWQGVNNEKCLKCHEDKTGTVKDKTAASDPHLAGKKKCYDCHVEHRGRFNNIRERGDEKCAECHEAGKYSEAKAVVIAESGESGIYFVHWAHLERGVFDNNSCDTCHRKNKNGEGFSLTVSYDNDCSGCHILDNHTVETEDKEYCGMCHLNNNYRVAAYGMKNNRLFIFSHGKHERFECVDCHENTLNEKAEGDVNCGNCHEKRHEGRKASDTCVACHRYHLS